LARGSCLSPLPFPCLSFPSASAAVIPDARSPPPGKPRASGVLRASFRSLVDHSPRPTAPSRSGAALSPRLQRWVERAQPVPRTEGLKETRKPSIELPRKTLSCQGRDQDGAIVSLA